MTTQLQSNRQELLKLKSEGKELLQQFFALKDKKRAALVELLKDASPEEQKSLRSSYQSGNKRLNESWKAEHSDLIARVQTLKEQIKSDVAILQELLEQVKKILPADEQFYSDLEVLFFGESEEAKAMKKKREIFEEQWERGTRNITYMTDERCEELVLTHKGDLSLRHLTSLTDKQAESLAKHEGELSLWLTSLTDKQAESLAKHKGDLELKDLTSLTNEQAESLSKHKGDLSLLGLTSLTNEQAESLSKHKGDLILSDTFKSKINRYRY